MHDNVDKIIENLRHRAKKQKYVSIASILGLLFIIWGGWSLFIDSSKIAAQDIQQRNLIANSSDAITKLARLELEIRKQKIEIGTAKYNLDSIPSEFSLPDNKRIISYFNEKFDSEKSAFYNRKITLAEMDRLISRIKDINGYFESELAPIEYIKTLKVQLDNLRKSLDDYVSKLDSYTRQLKETMAVAQESDIQNSESLTVIRASIDSTKNNILDTKVDINSLNSKIQSNNLESEAKTRINLLLSKNKLVLEELQKYRPEAEKIQSQYEEKIKHQKEIVESNEKKLDELEAEKKLFIAPNNITNFNDSKIEFYISTNIARLGVIVLTIFFAQIVVSIYRYSIKLSSFYNSRADALEILTQSDSFKINDLPTYIEIFSNVLSPDKIDFERLPNMASNEAVKSIESITKKQ